MGQNSSKFILKGASYQEDQFKMSVDEDDLVKTDSNTKSEESINQPTLPKPKFFMNCSNGSHM